MRIVVIAGFIIYSVALVWLLVGLLTDWRGAAGAGAVVALVGLGIQALVVLMILRERDEPSRQRRVPVGKIFTNTLLWSAPPIGTLAWANGAAGYSGLWVTLWIAGVAVALRLLVALSHKLDRLAYS